MQETWELSSTTDPTSPHRRYTVHPHPHPHHALNPGTEDLHAWSIYRQNLNSDFTDSALGSEERSPLPYGNFQLREQTVQSILRHPRLAPRSELANNMYAYLKFGLPRVFPPTKNGGLGSEIHPTSETGMTRNGHAVNGNGNVTRARSETDLLANGLISNRFRKPMNRSETNLAVEVDHHNHLHNNPPRPRTATSKAGSQASLVSRNSRRRRTSLGGLTNRGYTTEEGGGDEDDDSAIFEFPHLQVKNLGFDVGSKARVLEGISFDLHGGELLALLCTNGAEGTALLDVLAGRRGGGKGRIYGEFTLNGNPVSVDRLGCRVAYVRKDYRLHPSITVEQTLNLHHHLRTAQGDTGKYLSSRIHVLLDELGLGAVRRSLVSTLTSSERQRLVVACQLITGAEILLLNDATEGMDIFDTFFLVEYLRHWSRERDKGRIVIMTIHPPTYEIFSMFNKVALISTGRLMFYGNRREMLPYFAFIEYPCPAFKNPSDYYLDLVTLDNLSSEALLESSQRIETLADSYKRKQEVLRDPVGPPKALPPRIKNAGFFKQFYILLLSWIGYKFPWNFVDWMLTLMLATSLSITVGALYWNMRLVPTPGDQNNMNDRLGFHWVLSSLLVLPLILTLSSRDVRDMEYVTRDFEEKLYSKAVYFMAKNLVEIPYMLSIYLGYIVPAYVMAGISGMEENAYEHFYSFIGYMLLYLYILRLGFQALCYLLNKPSTSITLFILLFFFTSLSSFYTIHPSHLGEWISWVKYLSPLSWTLQRLIPNELIDVERFACPRNPVTQDSQIQIVTQLDCRINSGRVALDYFGFSRGGPILLNILGVTGIGFVSYLVGFFSFILRRQADKVPPIEKP